MRKEMCKQKSVVKKIQKAGELNGYAVELAEAQMQDYMTLKRDVDSVKESVNAMKLEQARQGGMIEAIFNRINSPVEQERKDGIVWHEIRNAVKSWKGWAFIIFFLFSVALAGDKLLQLLNWIPTGN
jgi:hypothetical protein